MRKIHTPVVASVLTLFTACTNPLTMAERQKFHTVGVATPQAKNSYYYDHAAAGVMVVGAASGAFTGALGALVAGGIAAGIVEAGKNRFAPITGPHTALTTQQTRLAVERALQSIGKKSAVPGDVRLTLDKVSFGVNQGRNGYFAMIHAAGKITDKKGNVLWSGAMLSSSKRSFTREQAMADPKLYENLILEAAENLDEAIVRSFNGERPG